MQSETLQYLSFDGITLQTERLRLRPFQESDAASILGLFMDKGFMEYSSAPMFKSLKEADALVVRDAEKRANGERLRLGIERLEDGAVIGYCDLFNIDRDSKKGEIGYGLLTKECGFGFMNEALLAFLNWVLNELQLNRVMAELDPANTNSEKIVMRLGFTKEGHFRENCIVNGVASDSVFYGLLKRDFSHARHHENGLPRS
jgi:RimJ/RimL family protein N-acetyltransferase